MLINANGFLKNKNNKKTKQNNKNKTKNKQTIINFCVENTLILTNSRSFIWIFSEDLYGLS